MALGLAALLATVSAAGAQARPKCFGKKATLVSSKKKIIGTKGHDVIVVRGKRSHFVNGLGGNDRICGGPGRDRIKGFRGVDRIDGRGGDDRITGYRGSDVLRGGGGDDVLMGQLGSDRLAGGAGDDSLSGSKGNDRLAGGSGSDRLEGSNGDDTLIGGPGDDTVIGGPGPDGMRAGPGDDILRGEGNSDLTDGGPGRDIASYSSSSTPIQLDLRQSGRKQWTRDGSDTLKGIEDAVGSPFDDEIHGDGGDNRIDGAAGYDLLQGGGGDDEAFGGPGGARCVGFRTQSNCGKVPQPSSGTVVLYSRGLDGDSLVVSGDRRANEIAIDRRGSSYVVTDGGPSGVYTGSAARSGCSSAGAGGRGGTAVCPVSGRLNFILATGSEGDDTIRLGAGVPRGVQARLNGGGGSDTIRGNDGDNVLEAGYPFRIKRDGGPTRGQDRLLGGGGHDSLYADSGGDLLSGGTGPDLLVSSPAVCQGHVFRGGRGKDTASWALVSAGRSVYSGRMRMSIGGRGGPTRGCGKGGLDRVGDDIDSLEGSNLGDTLIGSRRGNGFLGHDGADAFFGRGGKDYIDARDGHRDRRIDCGGGRESTVLRDRSDPRPTRCGR